MTSIEKAKQLNGKSIVFVEKNRNKVNSIILCDVNVGISVKPLDPKDVTGDCYNIETSDPNFFFFCVIIPRKRNPVKFDNVVEYLFSTSEVSTISFFENATGRSLPADSGSCPFSK